MSALHFTTSSIAPVQSRWPEEPTLAQMMDSISDDEVFDVRVLEPSQTGVPFRIWISTQLGSHGPRVKGYLGRTGRNQPSFSMSIDGEVPEVLASSYSERETQQAARQLAPWIALNALKLRTLWFDTDDWSDLQIRALVDSLQRV